MGGHVGCSASPARVPRPPRGATVRCSNSRMSPLPLVDLEQWRFCAHTFTTTRSSGRWGCRGDSGATRPTRASGDAGRQLLKGRQAAVEQRLEPPSSDLVSQFRRCKQLRNMRGELNGRRSNNDSLLVGMRKVERTSVPGSMSKARPALHGTCAALGSSRSPLGLQSVGWKWELRESGRAPL